MTINSFDQLTNFSEDENDGFIVEYLLIDDNGFCHRASPFLMPQGTIFEHEFGTYQVTSIDRKNKHIVVNCDRITVSHLAFDTLIKMRDNFN